MSNVMVGVGVVTERKDIPLLSDQELSKPPEQGILPPAKGTEPPTLKNVATQDQEVEATLSQDN